MLIIMNDDDVWIFLKTELYIHNIYELATCDQGAEHGAT